MHLIVKKNVLEEMKQKYPNAQHTVKNIELNGRKYIVTSYFVGNKDLNKTINEIATRQAYADIKISG